MQRLIKEHILNASIDLFAEHGINRVSVARIAQRIGATDGKIYYYFKNGKTDIIAEMLQMFEACIHSNIPNLTEWETKDADAEQLILKLFFEFPNEDALRLRKIVRIIMSEMFFDEQIAKYAINHFIEGREKLLSNCLRSLSYNGKISILDTESAARFINRLMIGYAIEDALRFPGEDIDGEQRKRTIRDYDNFIALIMSKR